MGVSPSGPSAWYAATSAASCAGSESRPTSTAGCAHASVLQLSELHEPCGQKRSATLRSSAAGSWKKLRNACSASCHLLLSSIDPDLSTTMYIATGCSLASSLVSAHDSKPLPPPPP